MQLIINVDESDIGCIKQYQRVIFSVSAFPEQTFTGNISQVRLNPITKGEIVYYQSLVTCNNSKLFLKPGMTATVTVEISKRKNVLRVRNEAFIVSPVEVEDEPGRRYVWRKRNLAIDEFAVERIEVKIGLEGDYYTELCSNKIKAGDDILISIHKKIMVRDKLDEYAK